MAFTKPLGSGLNNHDGDNDGDEYLVGKDLTFSTALSDIKEGTVEDKMTGTAISSTLLDKEDSTDDLEDVDDTVDDIIDEMELDELDITFLISWKFLTRRVCYKTDNFSTNKIIIN